MTYYRVRLQGCLQTLSELHIGSGEEEDTPAQQQPFTNKETDKEQQSTKFSTVLLDTKGKPYIPASTLRGFLRSQLLPEQADVLFGSGNEKDGVEMIGLVRIYDARWQSYPASFTPPEAKLLPIITRTSIDPVTQTAKPHHLASHQLIPVNTCFMIEIDQRLSALRADSASASLGKLDDALIQALLNALAHFNAESSAQLGKGKSVGQARLKWELQELKTISLEQLKIWTQAKNPKPLESYDQSIQDRFNPEPTLDTKWKRIPFQLKATSPLLINNPEDELVKSEEKGTPNQVFLKRMDEQDIALIPTSTLKGWCRARCRRILLTLTQNTRVDRVEELLVQLFGSTDQVGVLRFYDATVSYAEDDVHKQTFNAVDRFTDGVKEGALYCVHALYPKTAFQGQVAYQGLIPTWMKWLLLLVWRNAEEDDLVTGSDKVKGYGQLYLQQLKQGLQHYFESNVEALKQGADCLHQALNKTTDKEF